MDLLDQPALLRIRLRHHTDLPALALQGWLFCRKAKGD